MIRLVMFPFSERYWSENIVAEETFNLRNPFVVQALGNGWIAQSTETGYYSIFF